ncbi:DUF3592 domain-containing protein [Pleionea sp. CnH1-48]|uniref:DUF3592 domain-containing protein n=1 Tax=Pleionea sp. CnH1-48 TaxID=2954494 RepID=UPI0020971EB9|nr:DUF3592 domain-containing protein [Pleionea sp. CnH1-48]MCO7224284.1 DUF3592 domain-containing protein [Pleionea sp. CnH1-48]
MINRTLPIATRLKILFGGATNQGAWLFFGFSCIFFWIFAATADLSFIYYQGEVKKTQGQIFESYETNLEVNERSVYAYHYRFFLEGQGEFEDVSYSSGRRYGSGDNVTIEYPAGSPDKSRIAGLRRSEMGPWAALIGVFAFVGLLWLLLKLKASIKVTSLLKRGVIGEAVLASKERTNTEINDQTVYKLTFRFTDEKGDEHETVVKTHQTRALTDNKKEPVIYNPDKPDDAAMLDALPSQPQMDDQEVEDVGMKSAIASLIIPAIVIWGNLYMI